jgi:hypothetical protein
VPVHGFTYRRNIGLVMSEGEGYEALIEAWVAVSGAVA